MDHFSNQRRCCNNRRPGSPSCSCDDGCGMPPQCIMPAKPCQQVSQQRPVRPMPCPAPVQPNCGCASNIAPAKPCCGGVSNATPMPTPRPCCGNVSSAMPASKPNCGCVSNAAPMPKPNCGCVSNAAPMPQPNCGCVSNAAPMPQPNCGCVSNTMPMPRPKCGCGMSKSNPACTNSAVNNDPLACLVPGMCYVPWQRWPECPYEFCRAFQTGTIFPDLDKPFLIGRCARL